MNTPLCKICQVTGVLCASCEEKLRRGEITELDVKVSVFLARKSKSMREISNLTLMKTMTVDDMLVLLFKRGDSAKFIRSGRELMKELEREFGMRVVALDYHHNLKEFIEGVFYPTPVATINVIWLPDGSKETRVILEGRVKKRRVEMARKIIQKVKNVEVKVESI